MKRLPALLLISIVALASFACTSIQVAPLAPNLNMQSVCIEKNSAVIVSDFLDVVTEGFSRHGIATLVYSGTVPEQCEYIMKYTATLSWDLATYLKHAELRIYKNNQELASAIYHYRAGLGMNKWQSTKIKMDPVIDELLQQHQGGNVVSPQPVAESQATK